MRERRTSRPDGTFVPVAPRVPHPMLPRDDTRPRAVAVRVAAAGLVAGTALAVRGPALLVAAVVPAVVAVRILTADPLAGLVVALTGPAAGGLVAARRGTDTSTTIS